MPKGAVGSGPARQAVALIALALAGACAQPPRAPDPAPSATAPRDAQHAGINEPHGDHTPRAGGLVLMNGDVHYEVVMHQDGTYAVWFSDAIRTELPASVASNVRVQVTRPDGPVESLVLAIDEAGESWVGHGRPVSGAGVMVKFSYDLGGVPHEVETPFVAAAP